MKILILQACEKSYRNLLNISKLNKQFYADRHGYQLLSLEVDWDNLKPAVWIIPTVIYNTLCDKNYREFDYIYWTDVDSLVMNFNRKLEDIVAEGQYKNIIANMWSFDLEYYFDNLNGDIDIIRKPSTWFTIFSGGWMIKNDEWSRRLFGEVISDKRFLRKELAGTPMGDELPMTIYYLNNPQIRDHFCFLPTETFITVESKKAQHYRFHKRLGVPLYKEGDFVIHYPFLPLTEREDLMIKPEELRHERRIQV